MPRKPAPSPRYLTAREVADMFGVVPQTILNWFRQGNFPPPLAVNPNKFLWDRATVEALLKKRSVSAT